MVKTKKKLPKFVFGTGTFVLVASMFALGFVIRQQYVGSSVNQDVVSPVKHDQLAINRQYEKAVERIEGLALRYKNVTGKNFNLHPDMTSAKHTDSNLNTVTKPTAEDSTEPSPKVDIVIGMAQDIDPKNLVTFCSSLRKYSSPSSTEVVLFMNTPVAKRSRDIAEKYSIKIYEFGDSDYSNVSGKEYLDKYHPSSLRWMLISKYFENENIRKKYSKVLLIDVRDSYFQSDPFRIIPTSATDAFYVFKGVESITIANCGWNGGWVRDCFGNQILKEMGDNAIICSGVSIGTMGAVYEYLKLMEDILFFEKKSQLSIGAKLPECERNGVDQGVHNVLVHKNIIKHLSIMSERDGYVVNMQGRTANVVNKQVSNSKGDIFPIVHQYDRYPTLQKALFSEYVDWVNTNDPEAEWNGEEACHIYAHKNGVDLFKGRCDLTNRGGATSASSCCAFCTNTPTCKAFTFLDGSCFMKSCSEIVESGVLLDGAVSGFSTVHSREHS